MQFGQSFYFFFFSLAAPPPGIKRETGHGEPDSVKKTNFTCPSCTAEVELYVGLPYGSHNIGHSFIRVKNGEHGDEVIYDFGRYGKSWGYLKFSGEGIMRVWRGSESVDFFIAKQRGFRDTVGYTIRIKPEMEKNIYIYYESLISKAEQLGDYENHERYRLKRDFDGVTVQCTAMALEGLKKYMPEEFYQSLFDPKFNSGRGFTREQREYFFKTQKKLGIDHLAVPLDVIEALDSALKNKHPLLRKRQTYKKFSKKN